MNLSSLHRHALACLCLSAIALASPAASAAEPPTLHQEILKTPEPDGRRPLTVNPPTFRWPAFGSAPYSVELSRNADLAQATRRAPVKHLFDRPAQPLEPGRYWWRVKDAKGATLPAASFEVSRDTAKWPIPEWDEALAKLPKGRPRLLMRPEDLPRLRARTEGDGKPLVERWAKRVSGRIGAKLPGAAEEAAAWKLTKPNELGGTMKLEHVAKDWAAKIAGGMDLLCTLYLATGDTKYRDEIKRRGLATVAADPEGLTSHKSGDFANERMLLGLAWAYDTIYDHLTPDERTRIREALTNRLRQGFSRYLSYTESEIYRAHDWQHVIKSMTLGALAIYDEVPEAREWFVWGFKTHVAFYRWYGGADGGSAEGLGYYRGHNLRPAMEAAAMFEAAVGVSLMDHPWYRNTGYFFLYGAGLGTATSQFSDGASQKKISPAERATIAFLAGRFDDPVLAAYYKALGGTAADDNAESEGDSDGAEASDPVLSLLWKPKLPKPTSLAALPKSRAFPDIGVVFMRSALTEPENDIFFELRSSPYGNYVHAHADQNAFNVTAFGERLIVDTGYYNRYGDPHHRGWTKTTQAHNSILVGGKGQVEAKGRGDLSAYGEITAYEEDKGFVRVTGSAPHAYKNVNVTKFDRHVLWLQPDTYLIADDLETPEPQTFDWLLHGKNKIEIDGQVLRLKSGVAAGRLVFFGAGAKNLRFEQTDKFAAPPTGFGRDGKKGGKSETQWHLKASLPAPAAQQRFVTVLQVHRVGEESKLPKASVENTSDGVRVKLSDGREGGITWRK